MCKTGTNIVLDLGASIDCSKKNLIDFSLMGSALYKSLFPESEPRVAFLNIGSHCGERSMVDGGARLGSGSFLGNDCHLSGGAALGGILEPVGARPTIIEDSVFIGACSEIAEGTIVRKGSVISMGCYIGKSYRRKFKKRHEN